MPHGDDLRLHAGAMPLNIGVGEACSILSALAWAIGIMLYRQLGPACRRCG
jgi:hypothetical protein